MATATVTSKGQVTIPAEVRASLGLSTGDRLEFVPLAEGKYLFIASTHTVSDLKGMVKKPSSPVSIEDMNAAIESSGAGNQF
ncbi:AbrB/MazE/SpoVT family DNA-binding domain-containing protein [Halomonas sp. LR5S13]|uniref:AbrB/MazE/SpoVT family DNA-binding domain-containing protein n=1 Tax=Halomonas rhizosphaerae TaxID=3043296 RepID=UPI0024A80D67|nr:AbrB/MazE/SpoVT family DNA-binding domain-containing protein [Halomonas rhizosphaerae]MDI5922501.1 AbrB/MazE/SpoVT family DNA-binding domain-containing protein [Halomonas rhizosphaerae]